MAISKCESCAELADFGGNFFRVNLGRWFRANLRLAGLGRNLGCCSSGLDFRQFDRRLFWGKGSRLNFGFLFKSMRIHV